MTPYRPAWRTKTREIHECELSDYVDSGKVEWTKPGAKPMWYRREVERTDELIDRVLRENERQMELFK